MEILECSQPLWSLRLIFLLGYAGKSGQSLAGDDLVKEGRDRWQLPTGGCSSLKLRSTCFVPDSTPTLISVPRLDDADCYTLFGNGHCVTFENQDNGKLFHEALAKNKVILTGTKGPDRLYHLDTPRVHRVLLLNHPIIYV